MCFNDNSKVLTPQNIDGIIKPFHRIWRPMKNGSDACVYLDDHDYAQNPQDYIQGFLYLQTDIQKLFEIIYPADENLQTFSYKIHQLLIRCCIEIEANFKAIFNENKYSRRNENRWNIKDFKLIIISHHLKEYIVHFPVWNGEKNSFIPFADWDKDKDTLTWYDAYNKVKHNRQDNIKLASLENLLKAFSALFVLLSAQFHFNTYEPGIIALGMTNQYHGYKGYDFGIGNYLGITIPNNWKEEDKYDFEWNLNEDEVGRFARYDYDKLYELTYPEPGNELDKALQKFKSASHNFIEKLRLKASNSEWNNF